MDSSTDQVTAAELRQQLDERRSDIGQDLTAIGDRVSPKRMTERKTAAVRQRIGGVREAVMGAKDSVVDKAGDLGDRASTTGGAITDTASDAAAQIRRGPDVAKSQAQGNPVAAGIIAFGAGMLAATLLPESRREQEFVDEKVQPQLAHAAEQLGVVAQETAEAVRPEVEQAVSEVKDEAQQAVSQVRDQAQGATAEVADDAKQHVGDIRSA